jgi:hypothetical protein
VHQNVSGQKLQLPDTVEKFDKTDIIAHFHNALLVTHEGVDVVAVELAQDTARILGSGASHAGAVWSLPRCSDFTGLMNSIVAWTQGPLIYSARSLCHGLVVDEARRVQALVDMLIQCGHTGLEIEHVDSSGVESATFTCVKTLSDQNAVTCDGTKSNSSEWRLSPIGLAALVPVCTLLSARFMFHPREGVPVTELGQMELLTLLQIRNWTHKVRLPRTAVPPLTNDVNQPKIWYSLVTSSKLDKHYLMALSDSDAIFREGKASDIHHFQTPEYYKRLLGLEISGARSKNKGRASLGCGTEAAAHIDDDPEARQPTRRKRTLARRSIVPHAGAGVLDTRATKSKRGRGARRTRDSLPAADDPAVKFLKRRRRHKSVPLLLPSGEPSPLDDVPPEPPPLHFPGGALPLPPLHDLPLDPTVRPADEQPPLSPPPSPKASSTPSPKPKPSDGKDKADGSGSSSGSNSNSDESGGDSNQSLRTSEVLFGISSSGASDHEFDDERVVMPGIILRPRHDRDELSIVWHGMQLLFRRDKDSIEGTCVLHNFKMAAGLGTRCTRTLSCAPLPGETIDDAFSRAQNLVKQWLVAGYMQNIEDKDAHQDLPFDVEPGDMIDDATLDAIGLEIFQEIQAMAAAATASRGRGRGRGPTRARGRGVFDAGASDSASASVVRGGRPPRARGGRGRKS